MVGTSTQGGAKFTVKYDNKPYLIILKLFLFQLPPSKYFDEGTTVSCRHSRYLHSSFESQIGFKGHLLD